MSLPIVSLISASRYHNFFGFRVSCNGGEYEIVICPTNGISVMDPANLCRLYQPERREDNPEPNSQHPWQIVVPLQPFGTCCCHCRFCGYSRNKPVWLYATPEVELAILTYARDYAMAEGLVSNPAQVKFSLLKGGEISLHAGFENVLDAIYQTFPENWLKVSSIGSNNLNFFERLILYQSRHPQQRICLQLSVNSTDQDQRLWLVNKEDGNGIRLYDLAEIAAFAKKWKQLSFGHRCVTLTFTLMDSTARDPQALIKAFPDKESVVFRLRKMHNESGDDLQPISYHGYEKLYLALKTAGYRVILGNPTYDEVEHHLKPGWT